VTDHESLLSWTLRGARFGFAVALAGLSANVVTQGFWERVYAAADEGTLTRSFVAAALGSVPVVFLSGLFGIEAVGLRTVPAGEANVALFSLVGPTFAPPLLLAIVAFTVLLVSSTADSLLVGLVDLLRIDLPGVDPDRKLAEERTVAAVVAVAASAMPRSSSARSSCSSPSTCCVRPCSCPSSPGSTPTE
jgi:SSS family solute:Na+ symporter